MQRYLRGLETSEIDSLRTESGSLKAECVFCGRQYHFDDVGQEGRDAR